MACSCMQKAGGLGKPQQQQICSPGDWLCDLCGSVIHVTASSALNPLSLLHYHAASHGSTTVTVPQWQLGAQLKSPSAVKTAPDRLPGLLRLHT